MSTDRLYRRKDSRNRPVGPWIAWGFDGDGKRWSKSTRTEDRKAAEALLKQWTRDRADPAGARDKAARQACLADAVTLALDAYKAAVTVDKGSAVTVGYYTTKIGHARRIWGDRALLSVLDAPKVDAYIAQRRDEGVTDHTIRKELTCLSVTLQHARRKWPTLPDPATVLPVRFGANYKPRKRALTPDEVAAVLGQLAGRTPDHAGRVAFMVATSARWSETVRARREDIAEDLSMVYLRGTKTEGSDRTVPVWERAKLLILFALGHARGRDGLLFGHGDGFKKKLSKMTPENTPGLLAPFSANDLRRTCATWLTEAGASSDLVAPLMGHADSTMVERVYGRRSPAALARLLERATQEPAALPEKCSTSAAATPDKPGDARTDAHTETPEKLA